MPSLDLIVQQQAANAAPFPARVEVRGGTPNTTINVTVVQTRGAAPRYSSVNATTLDAAGNGSVPLTVTLNQQGFIPLLAHASLFVPDAETVQVL